VVPLFDDNSQRRTFPFVNYALIAANLAVFIWVYYLSNDTPYLVGNLSVIPYELQHCPLSACGWFQQRAQPEHAPLAHPVHRDVHACELESTFWGTCCSCGSSATMLRCHGPYPLPGVLSDLRNPGRLTQVMGHPQLRSEHNRCAESRTLAPAGPLPGCWRHTWSSILMRRSTR